MSGVRRLTWPRRAAVADYGWQSRRRESNSSLGWFEALDPAGKALRDVFLRHRLAIQRNNSKFPSGAVRCPTPVLRLKSKGYRIVLGRSALGRGPSTMTAELWPSLGADSGCP